MKLSPVITQLILARISYNVIVILISTLQKVARVIKVKIHNDIVY